jgi:hypothetical protein
MDVSKKSFGEEILALDTTLEEFFFVVKFFWKVCFLEPGKFLHDWSVNKFFWNIPDDRMIQAVILV